MGLSDGELPLGLLGLVRMRAVRIIPMIGCGPHERKSWGDGAAAEGSRRETF